MHMRRSLLASARVGLILQLAALSGAAQAHPAATEMTMQRCDRLPVVILQVDKEEKRFLVDTAATSFLNAKSFIGGHAKEVQIHSWNETTILHASDISIGELSLGSHVIRNVGLPAIHLTPTSKPSAAQLPVILAISLL